MNPPIKDFIKHPLCSDRIKEFCRELEQADAYQEFPIPKEYTSKENKILLDLIKNGYITCNLKIPLTIRKRKFYSNTLQSIYSCMQNGTDINNDPDFYNSLFIEYNNSPTKLAQIFIDALCTQDILWINNNLKPLYDYISHLYLHTSSNHNHEIYYSYMLNSVINLTIYCYFHPKTCTDPTFKKPTKSQEKLFLSNVLYPDRCIANNFYVPQINNSINTLKFLFGISDKYISNSFSPVMCVNYLFEKCFSDFNITPFPTFAPNLKKLIAISYFNCNARIEIELDLDCLIFPWWTAELIIYICQYPFTYRDFPSNIEIILYFLQNNASEKALELLKMEFLDTDEYPLLLNDICSESFNISAEDKTQIMNFLLQYIPDSTCC